MRPFDPALGSWRVGRLRQSMGGSVIIWQGWGIVVLGIGFAWLVAFFALAGALGMGQDADTLIVGLAAIPAGITTWFAGKRMNGRPGRELVDPATGERVVLKDTHSLFFVPVEWWGPILVVAGVVFVIVGVTSGPAA
jgi:hypothetical protein